MRVGIVTTLKLPAIRGRAPLESFIRYHLGVGFDHLFLFFDDPGDSALSTARTFPPNFVTAIPRDAEQREREKQCSRYDFLQDCLETEVQARQELNAQIAMQRSKELGLRWLVHIDIDELFFTRQNSVKGHFRSLEKQNIYQMTYLNHEAVPEMNDTEDYFRTTTLFRRHHFSVPISSSGRKCMKFWEERTSHGQYMLVYDCGKSAVRVTDGATPKSVHSWTLPAKSPRRSCTALADPRQMDLRAFVACKDPCILHFVVCGFSWFHDKYTTLGRFADSWYNGRLPIQPCFHTESRDVVMANSTVANNNNNDRSSHASSSHGNTVAVSKDAEGRDEAPEAEEAEEAGVQVMRAFFERQVLFPGSSADEGELERQMGAGVCVRITGAAAVIRLSMKHAEQGGVYRPEEQVEVAAAAVEEEEAADEVAKGAGQEAVAAEGASRSGGAGRIVARVEEVVEGRPGEGNSLSSSSVARAFTAARAHAAPATSAASATPAASANAAAVMRMMGLDLGDLVQQPTKQGAGGGGGKAGEAGGAAAGEVTGGAAVETAGAAGAAAGRPPGRSAAPVTDTDGEDGPAFTHEKAWILSSVAQNYL
jgi:hypothetical protein